MTELDHPSAASQDPIRDYLRLFVKDDEDLLEHVLIVCFSSFSSNPLNLGVMAPSSEGKSYVVSLVADLFKRATHITGSSAKAFFYENGTYVEEVEGENGQKAYADLQGKVDQLKKRIVQDREDSSAREEFRALMSKALLKVNMDRRIIVFSEPPGAELFEALKPLLSHDKWESIYQTVDKAGSGELRTKKILLVGWPAFIFCSAKNLDAWSMWPEIQSRCVIVSPRMDESKYRHANDLTAKLLGLPSFALRQLFPPDLEIAAREAVRDVELSMDRMRLLGQSEGAGSKRDNFVFNPFADQLSELFPHEQGVMMRQFSYLMKYVNMLTLTRVAKRPKLIIRDQARASIATLEDVQNAIRLVSTSIWAAVPAYKLAFCTDVLESAFIQAGNSPVSTKLLLSVARSKGMKIGPDSLRKTYLVPLEEAGLAVSEVDPTDKRSLVWSPVQMPQKYGRLRDSTNFSLLSTKRSLKSCSDGIGDLVLVFDKGYVWSGTEVLTLRENRVIWKTGGANHGPQPPTA
ncbi:MAG: hypothetical protein JRN09_09230, partial [Nitrososphaerota archaeon]|nr:hypothetical protein [Nitrososphaerota archaeon]